MPVIVMQTIVGVSGVEWISGGPNHPGDFL
jgi:hypothetical protein